MEKNIQLIRDLLKCTAGVSVSLISGTREEILALIHETSHGLVRQIARENFQAAASCKLRSGQVCQIWDFLNVNYLVTCISDTPRYLVIGPCLTEPFSETGVRRSLQERGFAPDAAAGILDSCRAMPVLKPDRLYQLGNIVARYFLREDQQITYTAIEYPWDTGCLKEYVMADHYDELSRIREVETRYEHSAALTEAVKAGNLPLACQYARLISQELRDAAHNPNQLRSAQNTCIVLNTQLRHAMEGSIHPYRLDHLSGEIAGQIERLKSREEAERFLMVIIRRYCELAQETRYKDLKPFSLLAVTYIKAHLSDNLTVKDTARALTVNANYLSSRFRQEVGVTFTDFVNRERADQAAALLKHTNLQIQQIASAVGYNHTSYFSKQFEKVYGATPRAYRLQFRGSENR